MLMWNLIIQYVMLYEHRWGVGGRGVIKGRNVLLQAQTIHCIFTAICRELANIAVTQRP